MTKLTPGTRVVKVAVTLGDREIDQLQRQLSVYRRYAEEAGQPPPSTYAECFSECLRWGIESINDWLYGEPEYDGPALTPGAR